MVMVFPPIRFVLDYLDRRRTEILSFPDSLTPLTRYQRTVMKRKRRMCQFNGHIFFVITHDLTSGRIVIECRRCSPHIDSRIESLLYDLFPSPDGEPL